MSFFVVLATSLKSSASKTTLPKLNTTANTRTLQSYGDSSSSLRNSGISPLASLALNKPVTKVGLAHILTKLFGRGICFLIALHLDFRFLVKILFQLLPIKIYLMR